MRRAVFAILFLGLGLSVVSIPRSVSIKPELAAQMSEAIPGDAAPVVAGGQTEATSAPAAADSYFIPAGFSDLPPQPQLQNPPSVVKAVYLTGWSAGNAKTVDRIISLIKRTELNAVIIDIKDYSGYVSYAMDIPLVKESGAMRDLRIASPNLVIKKFHDAGIYVIGRVTVFQDPMLAKLKPEWAMKNKTTGELWLDNKKLAWLDPAGQGSWDYVISIAKEAIGRGFDEINFDYIRFASDGSIGNISYPFWDQKTPRHKVIEKFFSYLREKMGSAKISADLFGLATVNNDDLGIGQVIEDAYRYFDYVAPMVYPSHYAKGFIGLSNPGAHPYEVMKYSLDKAAAKWLALAHPKTTSTEAIPEEKLGKLRPWIQDFNMGATYDAEMVRKEFQAVYDSLENGSSSAIYAGWMIWDPKNIYTEGALDKK